ncbi:hypothetical protein SLUN_16860 [Streptomyces lunaelactis]|uniref:Uncharacterized protein n=1 Tax=Streptomyces lunaelactis TaxID=1535768 RepID=A0A2R4T387_9ACTN|nr:hypothetical protein SLUN_16860 [Streptomyces lunaelactis]
MVVAHTVQVDRLHSYATGQGLLVQGASGRLGRCAESASGHEHANLGGGLPGEFMQAKPYALQAVEVFHALGARLDPKGRVLGGQRSHQGPVAGESGASLVQLGL